MKYKRFDIEEFERNAKPDDSFKEVQREMEVADYKEIYSKEYLLSSGLMTPEEYETIPASTRHADWCEGQQEVSKVIHQVAGAEVGLRD